MNFEDAYNDIVLEESVIEMNVSCEFDGIDLFELSTLVEVTEDITTTNNKIFFVITNWIDYSLENPWYFLVIAKSNEIDMDLTSMGETETYTTSLIVEIQQDWSLDDLYAVAIIQSIDNKKVLQVSQVQYQEISADNLIYVTPDAVLQNYPNPFNPSTAISFELNTEINQNTELLIYNLIGQKIKDFTNHQITQSPNHQIIWNGTDNNSRPVSSGIYFALLKQDNQILASRKMVLMK